MDAVDDIFSTPSLSLWESPHVASVFPFSSSPQNPQNFLRHSDNSAFPSTDNSFQHPLSDPQDLSPHLSPALASSFALPNSLPFSIPPNISQLQNLSTVFSQPLPTDNSLQQSQFNHPSLPFDINCIPNTADTQQPSLDLNPQFPPSLSHQSLRHHHQPPSTQLHSTQLHSTQPHSTQPHSTQPHSTQPKPSHNPTIAKSHSALNHTIRRNQPPTPNRSQQKTRHTRQPKQNTSSRTPPHHQQQPQQQQPQQQQPQQQPTLADNHQFLSNTSTATIRSRQTHSASHHHPATSIPLQQHIPTSQSNSNLLSDHNSSAPISRLSSISIPTPTIATATTTAASPSTTNATHRSPPHTPPSAKRPKSTATSNPKRSQVEPRSATPNTNIDKKPKQTHPTPSNHHRTTQTSAKQNSTLPTPTSPSASTLHNTLQHSTTALHATHRISRPRDKHARLRKRLKCCSPDQLVDHIIQLVRSSTIPEKIVTDNLPKVDIHRYVLKCRELRDSILCQLPQQPANPSAPFDATAFRKCKKSLAVFRTSVVNMAKTLVEASLWTDVIEFCIAADGVNAETPVWSEASHNKAKRSVRTKLEQFALKAATALSRPKEAAAFNRDDHARAMQGCQGVFPDVVAKLKGPTPSAPTESLTRSQDFDDPMISTSQLDIDI